MVPPTWLTLGVVAIVGLQFVGILALLVRNAVVEVRLARSRRQSRALDEAFVHLQADRSAPLRRTLARKEILRDIRSLELWLDLVAERGEDPAALDPEDFERVGIVERYTRELRGHREWTRRAAAAEILGWTHSPTAVPALLECVQDETGELASVRAVALRSLGRIRHPDVVPPLVESLGSPETWFPPMVAGILVRVGKPAVEPLCRLLSDHDAPIGPRRWAAQILGEIGHGRALIGLHAALSDVDAELRAKAAKALGLLADDRSIEALLDRLLVDPIPYVRTCVAKALAQMSTARTMEFLVEALADSEWWVRLRAVEGLAQFGDAARDILIGALHDRDPQVSREAARALEAQGFVARMLDALGRPDDAHEAREFLVDLGRAGNLEPLLDELESGDDERIREIVRVLSRIGDRRAGPSLAEVLERTPASSLQARIIDALRNVRDDDHTDRILPLLRSADEWVRKAAVDYLGDLANPDTLPLVRPLLRDDNPWTRESSLRLLARLRPRDGAPPEVVELLSDELEFVQAQAIRTLCACGSFEPLGSDHVLTLVEIPEVRAALLDGLTEAPAAEALPFVMRIVPHLDSGELDRLRHVVREAIRFTAVETLVELLREGGSVSPGPGFRWTVATVVSLLPGEEGLPPLEALTRDSDPRVRAAAASASGDLLRDEPAAWTRIEAALADEDPWVVQGAVRAMAMARGPEAERRLRRLLRHPEAGVRTDAAWGLTLCGGRTAQRALLPATQDRFLPIRLAATAGLALQGQPEALTSWLETLQDEESRAVLEAWDQQEHPLYHETMRMAGDDEGLGGRLVRCRTAFDAERELLEELDTNPDPDVRELSVEGFRALGSARAAGKIMSCYRRDPSPEVRASALGYLVTHDTYGQRLALLESALRDPVESIQVTAVHLTVVLPENVAIPLLVQHLDTRRPAFLDAVTDILAGRMEEDVEPILDEIMGVEATPELMLGLVGVLRKVTVELTTEVLELLLHHRWAEVRGEALRALVPRLPEGGLGYVLEAMADPSPEVRERAIHLLARSPDGGARRDEIEAAILYALRDPAPTVQTQAARAAGILGLQRARPGLRALSGDAHRGVGRAAERALQRLDHEPVEVPG